MVKNLGSGSPLARDLFPVVSRWAGTIVSPWDVVCSSPPDMKVDSRYFTFRRATRTYAADLQAYSRAKDDFVWEDMVIVTVKQGSTLPSNADIERGVAEAVSNKLLELTGKKSVTPVDTGTNSSAKAQ